MKDLMFSKPLFYFRGFYFVKKNARRVTGGTRGTRGTRFTNSLMLIRQIRRVSAVVHSFGSS